jgi:hypothetical protein
VPRAAAPSHFAVVDELAQRHTCRFRKLHPLEYRLLPNQNMIAVDDWLSFDPHAVGLFRVATAARSRNPGAAASTQRLAAACATSIAFALGRPRSLRLALSSLPRILDAITIVRPETVVRWHRMGFAAYWRWKSCSRPCKQLRCTGSSYVFSDCSRMIVLEYDLESKIQVRGASGKSRCGCLLSSCLGLCDIGSGYFWQPSHSQPVIRKQF